MSKTFAPKLSVSSNIKGKSVSLDLRTIVLWGTGLPSAKIVTRPWQGWGGVLCRLSEFKHHLCQCLIAHSRRWRHCLNFAGKGCLFSEFHFMRCRYFLGHVACRNLPCQGLSSRRIKTRVGHVSGRCWPETFRDNVDKDSKISWLPSWSLKLSMSNSMSSYWNSSPGTFSSALLAGFTDSWLVLWTLGSRGINFNAESLLIVAEIILCTALKNRKRMSKQARTPVKKLN